jgi:hypothetical protein
MQTQEWLDKPRTRRDQEIISTNNFHLMNQIQIRQLRTRKEREKCMHFHVHVPTTPEVVPYEYIPNIDWGCMCMAGNPENACIFTHDCAQHTEPRWFMLIRYDSWKKLNSKIAFPLSYFLFPYPLSQAWFRRLAPYHVRTCCVFGSLQSVH